MTHEEAEAVCIALADVHDRCELCALQAASHLYDLLPQYDWPLLVETALLDNYTDTQVRKAADHGTR